MAPGISFRPAFGTPSREKGIAVSKVCVGVSKTRVATTASGNVTHLIRSEAGLNRLGHQESLLHCNSKIIRKNDSVIPLKGEDRG